jgi:hypothetical protein
LKKVIVVIPVYKPVENLEHFEKISIKNTIDKFQKLYFIALLNSDKVSAQSYIDYFKFDFLSFEFAFSTWIEYNALLKNLVLYKKLEDYEYMLIVQTDAYVFSSDLNDFFQYDYIGAPWTKNPIKNIKGRVGNGGFSLRNIKQINSVFLSKKRMIGIRSLFYINFKHEYKYGKMNRFNGFKRFTLLQIFSISINTIFQYLFLNSFKNAYKFESIIEDVFYGVLIPANFSNYNVSNISDALRFSFDENPLHQFEMNNRKLPIGCHAFFRYYQLFWKNYIKQ